MSAKTTYKAGDVIDVAWCVSADHGGVPQFRLCDDEGLVSAVTTPGYEPTVADHEALEQCFQRGLLRCDGVESNTCAPAWKSTKIASTAFSSSDLISAGATRSRSATPTPRTGRRAPTGASTSIA